MKQINKWVNLNKYNLRNEDDNLLWDQNRYRIANYNIYSTKVRTVVLNDIK